VTGAVKSNMRCLAVLTLLLSVPDANAVVTASGPSGFVSEHELSIAAPRQQVFRALTAEVGRWWDPAHSYSGVAASFSIDATAGGCFCERWDGGSVAHMTVVFVEPDRQLRMQGGLGPLQSMAVSGTMTFVLDDEGAGTRLRYRYSVGGYAPDGLERLAQPVDRVQFGQLRRLQHYVETGNPVDASNRHPN
jgi:uncharacterized protein YndB with AHSA1/START domain